MTVKQEKPEHEASLEGANNHHDIDGPPPAKIMALTAKLSASSGASSESGRSHRSSSSESHDILAKINIKEEALTSLTMQHLLGLSQMSTSEKDTSGAESDGKVKSIEGFEGPDFSKIISDLKRNDDSLENISLENKSSDAIFKDLINSLPL